MTDLVIDASALVFALTESTARSAERAIEVRRRTSHAPHPLDADVGSVARRKVLRGELTERRGLDVVESAVETVS